MSEHDDTAELLLQLISRTMMHELQGEVDEPTALRKALLTLIMATQDGAPERVRELIDFLLTNFRPLALHFRDHTHPLRGEHVVVRALGHKGEHVMLAVDKAFLDDLTKDTRDDPSADGQPEE